MEATFRELLAHVSIEQRTSARCNPWMGQVIFFSAKPRLNRAAHFRALQHASVTVLSSKVNGVSIEQRTSARCNKLSIAISSKRLGGSQ